MNTLETAADIKIEQMFIAMKVAVEVHKEEYDEAYFYKTRGFMNNPPDQMGFHLRIGHGTTDVYSVKYTVGADGVAQWVNHIFSEKKRRSSKEPKKWLMVHLKFNTPANDMDTIWGLC